MTPFRTAQGKWTTPRVAGPAGPVLWVFATTSLVLAIGVVALSAVLPGTGALPVLAALLVFAIGAAVAGRSLQRSYPHQQLGLGNMVTLLRLALTAALVGPVIAAGGASWAVFAVASVALSLDALDGWFARRQALTSRFGARFDMEVDSLLALVLACSAAMVGGAGAIAILLGLPRYVFVLAASRQPWMHRDLPERFSRKAVCVIQIGALIALQAPILPSGLDVWLVVGTALALLWSFARDLVWLWRQHP